MSNYDEIRAAFASVPLFTRGELINYIKKDKPLAKDSTIGWILYELNKKQVIQRVAHDVYRIYPEDDSLIEFNANLTNVASDIIESLQRQFPLLTYIVWETYLFNEFANHQLMRNFIFVEVEKLLCESVFSTLSSQNEYITLCKPTVKEIALYSGDITVSVLPITSEAPVSGHNVRLEKLLVDLFANKLLDQIINRSEYSGIYEEAFSRYVINFNMLLRYARRRNKDQEITQFINDKTDITVIRRSSIND